MRYQLPRRFGIKDSSDSFACKPVENTPVLPEEQAVALAGPQKFVVPSFLFQ